MEFDAADFYKNYSTDYHIFKQRLYADILYDIPHYEEKIIGRKLEESEKKSLIFYLRLEIRQTLMHSIETLFEIILALKPSASGELYDSDIVERLLNSKWRKNNNIIREFAYEDSSLDFLDTEIDAYGVKTSILRYLFYPGLKLENEKNLFLNSINAIKFGLREIAKEFTNRADYNVIKHALRGIPFIKSLVIANSETSEIIANYDFSESMTFYKNKDNNKNEVEVVTKLFNSEFDLKLIEFTSGLIHNIMVLRESLFFRHSSEKVDKVTVRFFNDKMIEDLLECKKEVMEFKITIPKKVNDED